MAQDKAPIVIRRVKKVQAAGHHGGAWKVAYADFVTAMMAFFLVMWLVGATTNKQKAAISEYFKNPSPIAGKSLNPASGPNGPGGASTSMIKLGGTMELPRGDADKPDAKAAAQDKVIDTVKDPVKDKEEAKQIAKEAEHQRLQSLMSDLKAAIENSQALQPFKDQLLLDITPAGLRIQIVDKQNRPMFDSGSSSLKPYTVEILRELAKIIDEVPNRISISGHTDMTPFNNVKGYTNWELSADRANAARRAMIDGGLKDAKTSFVVGLASSVLFDKENPQAPINRRISIIVMTKEAEETATGQQLRDYSGGDGDSDSLTPPDAAPAGAPATAATSPGGAAQAQPAAIAAPPSMKPAVALPAIPAKPNG